MVVFDYESRYGEAMEELAGWLSCGKLKTSEYVVQGTVADFPDALRSLFAGANTGKLILAL